MRSSQGDGRLTVPDRITILGTSSGKVKIMDRLQDLQHFGKEVLVDWFLDERNVVQNVLGSRRADQRRGNVRVGAGILNSELYDVGSFFRAIIDGLSTAVDDCFSGRVPSGDSPGG